MTDADTIEAAKLMETLRAEVRGMPLKLRPIGEGVLSMAESALQSDARHEATIATLRAQLDSTLKDRALIIAERDALRDAFEKSQVLIAQATNGWKADVARADAAVTVKPHEIERLVFGAMVWGASQPQRKNGASFPNYHDTGNSNAETEARAIAARIRAAIGGAA